MAGKVDARYRKIETRLWSDQKFRRLTPLKPSGQALWLALLCHPDNGPIPGVICTGAAALADLLGWSVGDVRKHMAELEKEGMARADLDARVVFLPNAVRLNPPHAGNNVLGWRQSWLNVPECPLRDAIAVALREAIGLRWKDEADAVFGPLQSPQSSRLTTYPTTYPTPSPTALPTSLGTQEQDQEQDQQQEQEQQQDSSPSERSAASPAGPARSQPPPLMVFPCLPGTKGAPREWALTQSTVDGWAAAFPNVDILAAARKALEWVIANPRKMKTYSGMREFLRRWMEREQNDNRRGGAAPTARPQAQPGQSARDVRLDALFDEKGDPL